MRRGARRAAHHWTEGQAAERGGKIEPSSSSACTRSGSWCSSLVGLPVNEGSQTSGEAGYDQRGRRLPRRVGHLDANLVLLFFASMVVGLIAVGFASHRADRATVAIGIDASRRWVTIDDVQPALAAACAEANARQTVSAPNSNT